MVKSLEKVLLEFEISCLDGRDVTRLSQFLKSAQLEKLVGLPADFDKEHHDANIVPWTRENILVQLEKDLEFAFQKALDRRGISSSFMFNCIKMWNNILEEGLENPNEKEMYPMYGLPYYKLTALKYGWDNPIEEDTGSELYYNEDDDDLIYW